VASRVRIIRERGSRVWRPVQLQSQIKKEQETTRFVQAIRFSPELKFRSTPSAFDAQF